MAGELRKLTTVTVVPGSPGMPGDPGQAYQRARTIRKTSQVTTLEPVAQYVAGGDFRQLMSVMQQAIYQGKTANLAIFDIVSGLKDQSQTFYRAVTRTVTTVTYIPEKPYRPPRDPIPATPTQRLEDFHLGWNSGARSVLTYTGNLSYSFKVLPTVNGVITGISRPGRDTGVSYAEIEYALHFTGNHFRVVESGAEKTGFGLFSAGDTFTIERKGYQVNYKQNGTLVYASTVRAL
jgi:hypothetical protein